MANQQPLVSVIVAVKNGERYLASALTSIFSQDYQAFEVIVVDDGSIDATQAIANSFPGVSLIQEAGNGVANARNVGIDAANGEFIAFLSHDDLWTINKLSTQVNYLLQHSEIQYTIAKIKFFLEPGYSIPPTFKPQLLSQEPVGYIPETLVAKKSLFAAIGKFDTSLSVAEDVDWFSRASDYQITKAIIPQVLLYKRIHDANTSLTSQISDQNLLRVMRRSIKRKQNYV
ncbi:MAG TPA: glycosyltransferase [Oculatellaceae cyanobacterium]|jgi:glycosyltransferase involved in cell wall biosynthesis